jgi:hypothetical protein
MLIIQYNVNDDGIETSVAYVHVVDSKCVFRGWYNLYAHAFGFRLRSPVTADPAGHCWNRLM